MEELIKETNPLSEECDINKKSTTESYKELPIKKRVDTGNEFLTNLLCDIFLI